MDKARHCVPIIGFFRHTGVYFDGNGRAFSHPDNADSCAESRPRHASGSGHTNGDLHTSAKPDHAAQAAHVYDHATRANDDPFD